MLSTPGVRSEIVSVVRDPAWLPGNAGVMLRWYHRLDEAVVGQPRCSAVLAHAEALLDDGAGVTFHCLVHDGDGGDSLSVTRLPRDDILVGGDCLPTGVEALRPVAGVALRLARPVVILFRPADDPAGTMTCSLALPVRVDLQRTGLILVTDTAAGLGPM
ncbi:MAG: hypothetical protein RID91_13295 [Azospirillaceae bacterium]